MILKYILEQRYIKEFYNLLSPGCVKNTPSNDSSEYLDIAILSLIHKFYKNYLFLNFNKYNGYIFFYVKRENSIIFSDLYQNIWDIVDSEGDNCDLSFLIQKIESYLSDNKNIFLSC